jgi:hypothetical protein
MDSDQRQRFAEAVERKTVEADARARDRAQATPGTPDVDEGVQSSRVEHGRPQDTVSARAKNSGKGKKTADKWNQ